MESTVRTESLIVLPVEYWETDASIDGALVNNLNTGGLLMLSARDMPISTQLNVRIFYANEYELDGIEVVANIVSKGLHIAKDWKGYKYGLAFVQISEEDRRKLKDLLNRYPKMEKLPQSPDIIPGQPSTEKASSPPLADFDLAVYSTANCTFYEKGKCLKKSAFCDLCQTEDETILTQRARKTQKSRNHWSSPFASVLDKLDEKFEFTSKNR